MPEMTPLPWPAGLRPVATEPGVDGTGPLPHADLLIVCWTEAEAEATADVLTPGRSYERWTRYTHNWETFAPRIAADAPATAEKDLGVFWLSTVGTRTAVVMKSSLHLDRDGALTPIFDWWRQVIGEVRPSLVISTGTAGGVGQDTALGTVVATTSAQFDCREQFASQPWATQAYTAEMPPTPKWLSYATEELLPINAIRLPQDPIAGAPTVLLGPGVTVLTTDFFAFDTVDDHYGLRAYNGNARAVEMGDAALAQVAVALGQPYLLVRNASDPCIPVGPTASGEATAADADYVEYGAVTTFGSALVCWAYLAGDQAAAASTTGGT